MSDKGKEIRKWIQLALIVFIIGLLSYEFLCKELMKPAQEPTALELDVKLEQAGEKDGFIMIKGTINAVNPSSRRIYIPALWYTVEGRRIDTSKERVTTEAAPPESMPVQTAVRNYAPIASTEVVVEKKILSSRYPFWDPKDKTRDEISFAVPKGEFDFVDMKVSYLFARNNQELLDPGWTRGGDGELWAYFQFEQEKDQDQRNQWHYENGAGINWSTASLSLWEKPKN